MQDYRVELDVYHGPLDLLLYLIKRDEIDIHDIPIAPITEQYLAYLQTLKALDINLAGEFLVMAATLMEIKSAMMAPRDPQDPDDDDPNASAAADSADPRYELVQQLLAYKRFKDAAHALDRRRERFAAMFPRRPAPFQPESPDQPEDNAPPPIDLEDLSVWDLMEAFNRLMEQVGGPPRVDLVHDDTPLELHATDIFDRLQREGPLTLQQMFEGRRNLSEMIGLFLATLELLRQRRIAARQPEPDAPIHLELRPEDDWLQHDFDRPADSLNTGSDGRLQDAPPTNERPDHTNPDLFDWPDERTKQRYTRRMELRAKGQIIIEDAELEEDLKAIEAQDSADADPDAETRGIVVEAANSAAHTSTAGP